MRTTTTALADGDLVVLATDGIDSGFAPALAIGGSAQAVAERVLERHGRASDDALAVVVRYHAGIEPRAGDYTRRTMKTEIHPEYVEAHVRCTCGNEFTTRSTTPEIRVEICSNCHPFYTGRQKLVDTGGRVERFKRRAARRARA